MATKQAQNAYPKMLYGKDGATTVVADEAAHKGLKGTWADSPTGVPGYKAPDEAAAVSQENQAPSRELETLPKDHTYRDRVEAQAKALGIEVVEGETLEYLMWKIRMRASS